MNRMFSATAVFAAALLLTSCGTEIERDSSAVITTRETEASETTETYVFTAATTTEETTGAPPANAQTANISWRDCYAAKLHDYAATAGYIPASMNAESHSRYGLCDMDGNGLPELLIAYNSDETTVCTIYYLASDGQVLVAGEVGKEGCFEWDAARRLAVVRTTDASGNRYMAYKLSGSSVVPELTMSDSLGEELFPPEGEAQTAESSEGAEEQEEYGANASYIINDNPVERAEYLEYYNSYWNASLTKMGGLYDFDANISPDKLVW